MFEQNKSYLYIFLLALAFLGIATDVKSSENFIDFKERREAALHQIKIGNTKVGLINLVKLSDKGDGVSSHTLGLFYLKAHNIVRPNIDKAVQLFGLGASQCYEPSLNVLKKNFWGNKTSKYYDLKKINLLEVKCEKIRQENFEEQRRAEAEEQRRAEAEEQRRAEAEEQRRAEAKRKEFATQKPSTVDEKQAIPTEVILAWSKVLPNFERKLGSGSGFAIDKNGHFLTNHHVIEGCSKLSVQYNGLSGIAETIIFSEQLDLAIIKVRAPTPYFGKFDNSILKGGESLVAVGYPVSFIFGEEPTVSEGRLTNTSDSETMLRREGFLLTSVPMTQGNSGGPILSSSRGIRGIAASVADIPELEAFLKKEYGASPTLSNLSFGMMVSGKRAFNWILKNATFVSIAEIENEKTNDTKFIAETGLKILAKVNCFED